MFESPTLLQIEGVMADEMKCPRCGGTATRDPENRADRFVCECGWVSWQRRVEMLQEFLVKESEQHKNV